jgi:pilus assembly protein Flp/PilA
MKTLLRRLIWEEQGQDLIEYAMLAGFIALAATAVLIVIGPKITALFQLISTDLTSAGS